MYECAVAWLSCSGRLSRVGEDYRVGWGDMGEVTKDSIQKLYFEQRIRPLIHALQQPPATSHPPSASRINQQNSRLIPLSSSIFYYFRPRSNSLHLSSITTSYSACHCYSCSLIPTCKAARLASYGYCWLFVFFVFLTLPTFGRRRTANGRRNYKDMQELSLIAPWLEEEAKAHNGVVVVQPLAQAPYNYATMQLYLQMLRVINICRSSQHVAIMLYCY